MLIISDPQLYLDKEKTDLAVREQEKKVFTDEDVAKLPVTPSRFKHHDEWQDRKGMFSRLQKHIAYKYKDQKLKVLDIGCGNGWMSHQLSKLGHTVTGIDINMKELEQAERVFGESDTLKWVYADIYDEKFPPQRYDLIVMASSIQYIPDPSRLTDLLRTLMIRGAEVHITGSKFYGDGEMVRAKKKSNDYFLHLGHPAMALYLYHHSKKLMEELDYKRLHPSSFSLFGGTDNEWWVLYY